MTFSGAGNRLYSIAASVIYASVLGNELVDRSTPDGAARISFIDRDLMFAGNGKIVSWDAYAGRAGEQRLQVWRVGNGDGTGCEGACSVSAAATGQKTWTLVCENVVRSPTAGAGALIFASALFGLVHFVNKICMAQSSTSRSARAPSAT